MTRWPLICCVLLLPALSRAELRFNRDIRPILADKCFNCHGVDEASRKAKLRLDTPEGAYADRDGFQAVIPGDPDESELIYRIFIDDEDEVMPPPDSPHQLSEQEKQLLKQWIREGGSYEGHWAFQQPKQAAVPDAGSWGRNPIDGFVLRRLQEAGLSPREEADKTTLIRRLSLDLIGLPPTPEEVDAFLADPAPDAYERLVDRLLASPHYGERMAMWWLDGARYADTHGFQADWERYQWPWRDWVINAFNANQPFDQFTIEQLAGDLLPNPTNAQIVATGFNRNHRINTEGGALAEEWHVENVIDRLETTGSVWMALTFNCCRCHDHKYDPISQKEFYQFYAFFNNVPERGFERGRPGNFEPVIQVEDPNQGAELAGLKKELEAAKTALTRKQDALVASLKPTDAEAAETSWAIIRKLTARSKGGASFEQLDDGSHRTTGKNPKRDTYTLTFQTGPEPVTALLLQALPDPSFTNKGFSRGSNGNIVLTNISAAVVGGKGKPKTVKLTNPEASYAQDKWPVKNALDGRKTTGWAINGQLYQEPRKALFEFAQPLQLSDGQSLQLTLSFGAFDHHNIGRFRIGLTRDAHPSLGDDEIMDEATRIALATAHAKRSPQQIALLRTWLAQRPPAEAKALAATVAELEKKIAGLDKKRPTVMVMREMDKPRDAFVLNRGEYDQKGEKVTAGLPAILPPLPDGEAMNRLGLARWLVTGSHPLTARVQMNRFWENLFGTGLVKSSENLGTQADWPSHPELLDWLAVEFVNRGWDMKAMLKLMVTSAAYRQSTAVDAPRLERDPANRLVSRGPRFRLQAEMIRDQALAVSGLLNPEIGGPSVRPYQPEGIWSEFNFYGNLRNYKHDTDGNQYRRSLYTIWKRTAAPPAMTLFDMGSREVCSVRRSRSNTPLQALALMNDVTYLEAARVLAERSMTSGQRPDAWIRTAFRKATAREILSSELDILRQGYQRRLERYQESPAEAAKLLVQGETPANTSLNPNELAAMTTVASLILNLDEVVTRE